MLYPGENGTFQQVSGISFDVDTQISHSIKVNENVSNFDDIEKDSWYEKAVLWAKQTGIVNCVTETEFSPNENITREQIATIMHCYENYKKHNTEIFETTNIDGFDDAENVSDYAEISMKWAIGYGLIKGKTSATINPVHLLQINLFNAENIA